MDKLPKKVGESENYPSKVLMVETSNRKSVIIQK